MNYKLMVLLGLGMISGVYATDSVNNNPDQYNFQNNQTVTVKLSTDDANRIFVQGDKVKDIGCMKGFCVSKEFDNGDAIIKLGDAARFAQSGFTVFVSTQGGRQFAMQVIPQSIPGKTVEFTPLSGAPLTIKHDEKNAPYQESLINLIKAMMKYDQTGKVVDGYGVADIPNAKSESFNGDLIIFPIRLFQGDQLMGVVYEIKNDGKKEKTINGAAFYKHKMRAIAVSKETLKAGETTRIYEVVSQQVF